MKAAMKPAWILAALGLAAVLVTAVAPFVGMEDVPLAALWGGGDAGEAAILWKIRIPRVAMALLAGAALAASGLAFQAMFRNPLAEPFTLGVSSGASLGAALAIRLGWESHALVWVPAVCWAAFAGTLAATLLIYGLTRMKRGFSVATMLLAGVAVSFFFSSLILLMQYLSDFTQTFRMLRWVMGGLDRVVGLDDVLTVLPFVVTGTLVVFYLTHELNLITTGEDLAASRGVEVQRTKIVLFFGVSLMVGAVVSVCGPIGFVGLMAPHVGRLLVGSDHRVLTPATLLFGAAFLTVCDTLARTVLGPAELPVGILTALLGGPFFLWLLLGQSDLEP